MSDFQKSWENHTNTDRQGWIDGMRQLCDVLETFEDLPLPDVGTWMHHRVSSQKSVYNEDTNEWEHEYDTLEMKAYYKRAAKTLVKAVGADEITKKVPNEWNKDFSVRTFFGPIEYEINLNSARVCKKVKVGTEVLPAEPEKIIEAKPERIVDKYEYECADDLVSILK